MLLDVFVDWLMELINHSEDNYRNFQKLRNSVKVIYPNLKELDKDFPVLLSKAKPYLKYFQSKDLSSQMHTLTALLVNLVYQYEPEDIVDRVVSMYEQLDIPKNYPQAVGVGYESYSYSQGTTWLSNVSDLLILAYQKFVEKVGPNYPRKATPYKRCVNEVADIVNIMLPVTPPLEWAVTPVKPQLKLHVLLGLYRLKDLKDYSEAILNKFRDYKAREILSPISVLFYPEYLSNWWLDPSRDQQIALYLLLYVLAKRDTIRVPSVEAFQEYCKETGVTKGLPIIPFRLGSKNYTREYGCTYYKRVLTKYSFSGKGCIHDQFTILGYIISEPTKISYNHGSQTKAIVESIINEETTFVLNI